MHKISIILPCLNELENLKVLVKEITKICEKFTIEIIIIDDNSSDGTDAYFNENKSNSVKYIKRVENNSLGASVLEGLNSARYEHMIVMDSDYNHNPTDITKFFNFIINNNYDFVSGSRFVKGGFGNNYFRHFSSKIYSFTLSLLLNIDLKDFLSGFFLIKKNVFINLNNKEKIFYGYGEYYIRLLYSLKKINKDIKEIPVVYGVRKFGTSKSNFLKMLFSYFYHAIKFKIKFKNL